jgi:hypothetical protein
VNWQQQRPNGGIGGVVLTSNDFFNSLSRIGRSPGGIQLAALDSAGMDRSPEGSLRVIGRSPGGIQLAALDSAGKDRSPEGSSYG